MKQNNDVTFKQKKNKIEKLKKKLLLIWYGIIYPIAGIMLLILLIDIYTGRVNTENGSTIPHQAYIIVLAVIMHVMYRLMNGEIWIGKEK